MDLAATLENLNAFILLLSQELLIVIKVNVAIWVDTSDTHLALAIRLHIKVLLVIFIVIAKLLLRVLIPTILFRSVVILRISCSTLRIRSFNTTSF